MKKLLLMLGITSLVTMGANGALAAEGCNTCQKPKTECGCMNKPEKMDTCEKCETCHEMASKNTLMDCYDRKKEEYYCRLNLDQCQKQEAKKIEDSYRASLDNAKDNLKESHKCLCEKIQAPCLDRKAVRAQAKEVKANLKDVKSTLKCMDKEFKKILMKDQKKEYRKIKCEMNFRVKMGMKYCCKPCECK